MAERASGSASTSRTATRHRWKAAEREVAAHLGGVRVPVNGRGYAPDVDHPLLCLEVKQTSNSPQRIEKAVCQAERASEWCRQKQGAEKLPVAVIHQAGRPMGKSLVVMRLEDFKAWFRSRVDVEGHRTAPVPIECRGSGWVPESSGGRCSTGG